MNILGHNYIAFRLLGHVSPNTLLGSHIPDFVPFLPSSIFTFEEIHENNEDLLKFVGTNYPKSLDLPLSMLCHSIKYGADEYSREIDTWLLENNEKLEDKLSKMISKASNITYETARGPRLHNYLWCGVDLYLIKNNPDNIVKKLVSSLDNINYKNTAHILGDYYKKDVKGVETNLRQHFGLLKSETFQNTKGFTEFWSKFLLPLKENDNLDIKEGIKLLEFIYKTFEDEWENIMNQVEQKVKQKMKPFLN